jgi:hypothetical protein
MPWGDVGSIAGDFHELTLKKALEEGVELAVEVGIFNELAGKV